MVEHNNSSRYNDNKGKRKHHDNTRADPNKKAKPTCWKCGKTGHIKRDCKGVNVGNKVNGSGTKGSVDGSSKSLVTPPNRVIPLKRPDSESRIPWGSLRWFSRFANLGSVRGLVGCAMGWNELVEGSWFVRLKPCYVADLTAGGDWSSFDLGLGRGGSRYPNFVRVGYHVDVT
ncbi:zinc finger, CCHC-type containing protein [Tanacetum coccineum]